MAVTRSFANANQVTDFTPELLVVPNRWGYVSQLGLFEEQGVDQYTITFDEITKSIGLIGDKARGQRASVGTDYQRKTRSWVVPFYPLDDFILPGDVKGKRAYGSADQEDTLAAARARKLERIAESHYRTLDYARAKVITTGDVYSPNGTTSLNYYTEFGVTQTVVSFALGTATTDVMGKIDTCVSTILNNANGANVSSITALCSPTFFSALINHAKIVAAYQFYASQQEPLRNRLGGNVAMHREFVFGGVRFVEMWDTYGTEQLIPAGDAYFIAEGTDSFQTYFAPAARFDLLGSVGEKMYVFEYASPRGDKLELESESSFLNANTRPQLVIRATLA